MKIFPWTFEFLSNREAYDQIIRLIKRRIRKNTANKVLINRAISESKNFSLNKYRANTVDESFQFCLP